MMFAKHGDSRICVQPNAVQKFECAAFDCHLDLCPGRSVEGRKFGAGRLVYIYIYADLRRYIYSCVYACICIYIYVAAGRNHVWVKLLL